MAEDGDEAAAASKRVGLTATTTSSMSMDMEKAADGNAERRKPLTSIVRLFLACMVSGGIQYGWALQLSLLSPYSQTLGIPHSFVSLTWICGPIAGFVVQPIVGYYSDRCTARIGRRRPFILVGCLIICISVTLIGFSADIGRLLGDTKEHCSTFTGSRWSAAAIYIVGFWFLDFANNTVQGPARAMMADLSAGQHGPNVGQAIFSLWMAIGSVLGYLAGANAKWHEWFPSLKTAACCDACANLKGAFLTAVLLIIITMTVTMFVAGEEQLRKEDDALDAGGCCSAFADLFKSLRNLPPAMFKVLAVTAVAWLSWFPFFQYNTDWMGREIYRGTPQGTAAMTDAYNSGVREGAIGLLFCSLALGAASFTVPGLCRRLTSRVVWSISSLLVFAVMAAMVVLGFVSTKGYDAATLAAGGLTGPDPTLRAAALAAFALIGVPQAVLYSVPTAVGRGVGGGDEGGRRAGAHHRRPQHRHRRPAAGDRAHRRPRRRGFQQGQRAGLCRRRRLRAHLRGHGARPAAQDTRGHVRRRRHDGCRWRPLTDLDRIPLDASH